MIFMWTMLLAKKFSLIRENDFYYAMIFLCFMVDQGVIFIIMAILGAHK